MGYSQTEWHLSLKKAFPTLRLSTQDWTAEIDIAMDAHEAHAPEQGRLRLTWTPLPTRHIALLRIPRLAVRFEFEGLSDAARGRFMRRFDLLLQRGGG